MIDVDHDRDYEIALDQELGVVPFPTLSTGPTWACWRCVKKRSAPCGLAQCPGEDKADDDVQWWDR